MRRKYDEVSRGFAQTFPDSLMVRGQHQSLGSLDLASRVDEAGSIVFAVVVEKRRAEYEMCLPHQKPMDVVCLEDMVRICAKFQYSL